MNRAAAGILAGATLGLITAALVRASHSTPTRAAAYHAYMTTCRRLAAGFGAAGIRAELLYRTTVEDR